MDMAEYFNGQFGHITLAIPFNRHQIDHLNKLLNDQYMAIMVDDISTTRFLAAEAAGPLGVWIEIDTGSNRSGLDPRKPADVQQIIDEVENNHKLSLEGLYSHAGHTYAARSEKAVLEIFEKARKDLVELKLQLKTSSDLNLNLGDTPGCSLSENFEGIQSISPGNFVFYDVTQSEIKACGTDKIAVCLASPIISKNEDRRELVIYGGGIHLSKDRVEIKGQTTFGLMVKLGGNKWSNPVEGCYLRSISQEHGVISVTDEVFEQFDVGDTVGILPVHSCMTADCMGRYFTLSGIEVDHMRVER